MFRITYRPVNSPDWEMHRCRLSGRQDFDLGEANYKARWLVTRRHADEVIVADAEGVGAHWLWNDVAREPRKLIGPDL